MSETAEWTLRTAQAEDEEFLSSLYRATRADEVAAWGWDAVTSDAFLSMQYRAQSLHYRTLYPDAEHWLVLADERPAGRMFVAVAEASLVLVDIALLPAYRNRGGGRQLIAGLQARAEKRRMVMQLHVRKDNTSAIRLYDRLGFRTVVETELDLQMEWRPAIDGGGDRR